MTGVKIAWAVLLGLFGALGTVLLLAGDTSSTEVAGWIFVGMFTVGWILFGGMIFSDNRPPG